MPPARVYRRRVVSSRAQQRRRASRRSTLLAVGGLLLVALGVVLTLARVVGDVVPTVLALVGVVVFVAGLATGTRLVFDNFRYRREQSYFDPDEEPDE